MHRYRRTHATAYRCSDIDLPIDCSAVKPADRRADTGTDSGPDCSPNNSANSGTNRSADHSRPINRPTDDTTPHHTIPDVGEPDLCTYYSRTDVESNGRAVGWAYATPLRCCNGLVQSYVDDMPTFAPSWDQRIHVRVPRWVRSGGARIVNELRCHRGSYSSTECAAKHADANSCTHTNTDIGEVQWCLRSGVVPLSAARLRRERQQLSGKLSKLLYGRAITKPHTVSDAGFFQCDKSPAVYRRNRVRRRQP